MLKLKMYKKTIKRGEKKYTYYTNVREEGKVKNIFLNFNKELNGAIFTNLDILEKEL